jgi:hypothetical protein
MSKTSYFLLIALCLLFVIQFIYVIVTYSDSTTKTKEQLLNERFSTVKIDGEEYLYGHYYKNVILIPKVKPCNCKCENK